MMAISAVVLSSYQAVAQKPTSPKKESFNVMAESFADLQVLRYQVPGFEKLTPKQKDKN